MKNLITRCISKDRINSNVLMKHTVTGVYFKNIARCSCWGAQSVNLTSNDARTNQNNVNRSTFLDVRKRFYSSNSGPPSTKLPPLMNFPEVVWPSLIKSIRNFILSTFIIKPYFDKDFNLPDFVQGSKRALEVVSAKISEGDIKALDGLVTNDVILSLQKSISYMSVFQREQISINSEDIYFSFPYQVGIMFNEQEGKEQKRFVEITMVYHTLRGLAAMRERGEEPPLNVGMVPEFQKRISICNYRFIRDFTKGSESDWTINLLNHFKPTDQMEQ